MNCAMRYAAATSEEKKAEEVALMAKMLNEEIPDLEAQVAALKSQLMKNREDKQRSDQLMAALKSQLTEMRSKYENRITTMEKQHLSQVIDLTAKLDAEKNSRAEAVERTVALQAQLYKYKLQYGDLQE
nr:hypothetical protein BaRGS_009684 [Batillaria attramentaria]